MGLERLAGFSEEHVSSVGRRRVEKGSFTPGCLDECNFEGETEASRTLQGLSEERIGSMPIVTDSQKAGLQAFAL